MYLPFSVFLNISLNHALALIKIVYYHVIDGVALRLFCLIIRA